MKRVGLTMACSVALAAATLACAAPVLPPQPARPTSQPALQTPMPTPVPPTPQPARKPRTPIPPTPTLQPGAPTLAPARSCDPSYPTVCIPPPPPNLNCRDIPYRQFRVLPPDPHGFDRDKDGIGCESP